MMSKRRKRRQRGKRIEERKLALKVWVRLQRRQGPSEMPPAPHWLRHFSSVAQELHTLVVDQNSLEYETTTREIAYRRKKDTAAKKRRRTYIKNVYLAKHKPVIE